jgi:hypothetical protein
MALVTRLNGLVELARHEVLLQQRVDGRLELLHSVTKPWQRRAQHARTHEGQPHTCTFHCHAVLADCERVSDDMNGANY